MMMLLSLYDKLMGKLPANGEKTVIAMAMKLILPAVATQAPILLPLMPGLQEVLTGLLVAFVAHKGAKTALKK